MQPSLITGTLLSRHFINDTTTKHQRKRQHYLWHTSVCILIINELVNKVGGYLTSPTPSSSLVYITVNFHSVCCFDWSFKVFVSENRVRIVRKLLLRRTFRIFFFFFCAKSVEKMKQSGGPRAVRTVRACVSVWTKTITGFNWDSCWYFQGDKEADLGLPFSPLCDRKSTMVAQSQIGEWLLCPFIDHLRDSLGLCGRKCSIPTAYHPRYVMYTLKSKK